MALADELDAVTVTLEAQVRGELAEITARLDHPSWEAMDHEGESYAWSIVLELQLATGELRRAWYEGSHDDANLGDNVPNVTARVLAGHLSSLLRARVRGALAFEDGPRIAWDQEMGPCTTALRLVGEAPALAPRPMTLPVSVQSLSITPPDAPDRVVACLPERGIVTRSPTTGYTLHTPAGPRALPEIERILGALPGRETERREHRGGARGRFAIGRQATTHSHDQHEQIVLFEIDAGRARLLSTNDGMSLTRDGFDPDGTLLPVRTRWRRVEANTETFGSATQVFDCDAGRLLDWRGPLADRWQIDGDVLVGTKGTTLHLVPRAGVASSTDVSVGVGPHPLGAWNRTSGVAAWTEERGRSLPQALHCHHPSWGVRTVAVSGRHPTALAVLRSGHVVVATDNLLLLVDPTRGEVAELASRCGDLGDLLHVVETNDRVTLWTCDPKHWRVDVSLGAAHD